MKNIKISAFIVFLFVLILSGACFSAEKARENPVLKAWSHENRFSSQGGDQELTIKATYYSNEYVEALIASEAEQNMWTNDEMENYKYTLLKNLNLAESIPFHIDMYVRGIPMYPGPFDKHIKMRVGKKVYEPIDFDKRLNFKILGQRDGLVFFPRYDPKTGKDVLEGARDVRLIFDSSISYAMSGRSDLIWVWDLGRDRGSITHGKASDRLEIDRLIKRTDKINADREALQKQLDALTKEYNEINSRIDELQSK